MLQEILKYRIEREIGEGGMSRVYKGVDPNTGQQVAIKELLPHLAHHNEIRQRFLREAQVMAILNHPHIVRLIRYEESGDNLYLVQEYIDGMNLAEYIGEHRGAIPESDAIRLFRQILEALSYAHEAGVVHRDIKPSNILLKPTGEVKVLDFGIARIVGDESGGFRTKTGTRIGTVAYMSPEQVNAKADIDHRSDIYSAGVLLYHMLTGKAPYDMSTDSDFQVQLKIVKEQLPRMREINPEVSEKMQRIVDKATAKSREARYQSCGEFMQAMSERKQQLPDPIHPVPPPPPPPNLVTKIAVIAACVIALVLGLIWMAGSSNVAEQSGEAVVAEEAAPEVASETLYLEGNEAYEAKEYDKAYSLYKKAAEDGYAPAQNDLGYMYMKGEGVEENDVEVVKWYRKAALQGLEDARTRLEEMGERVEAK
jgi:serine/threonine protein kinase